MQGKCFYYFVSLVCSKIFIGQQCVKRVCVFCFAKALRTVLDYWQFENLHSLSFAIAKQLLISIFSLGRRSVRYCSLQPCQNPLCRQSAFSASDPRCVRVRLFQFTFKLVMIFPNQSIYPCGIAHSLTRNRTPKFAKKNEVFPQTRNCIVQFLYQLLLKSRK